MEQDIKKIIVLLEFEDGSVRQVLTTRHQKDVALHLLKDDTGEVCVSDEIEPFTFTFKPK